MAKRVLDVILAVLGLILAAPLGVLIALAIRVDSPGPVIYSQRRLGKGGRTFLLHKFRKFPDTIGSAGPGVTVAGDARMTGVGWILERTKLDELPQLWNILKGEMSFVGPRPESLRYRDLFQGDLVQVLDYLPGVFGPNQVAFRNESELYPPDQDPEAFYRTVLFPQKARADIAYFRNASLYTDVAWIRRGIWISLAGAINWRRTIGLHGPILVLDLLAVTLAWILVNGLRFEGLPSGGNAEVFAAGLWLLPAVLLPTLVSLGAYRHAVRHFGLSDAQRLAVATLVGWVLVYLLMLGLLYRNASLFLAPFGYLLSLALMVGVRLWRREAWRREAPRQRRDQLHHILIYGAGRRGTTLVPLLQSGFRYTKVLGFLDDDARLRGRLVMGLRHLGAERDLATVHALHPIDQLWLTFRPDSSKRHRLTQWCLANGVSLVVLPDTATFGPLCRSAHTGSGGEPRAPWVPAPREGTGPSRPVPEPSRQVA